MLSVYDLDGSTVISKDDFWGNSSIISKLSPPQCFGISYALSSDGISGVNVIAESDVTVMFFEADNLLHITGAGCSVRSRIITNLVTIIANKNIQLSSKIEYISQRKLRDKVLTYLSDVCQRKKSNSFDIPFSRKQLADYLCADRSALSNELCKLRDVGILNFNKNHFELNEYM